MGVQREMRGNIAHGAGTKPPRQMERPARYSEFIFCFTAPGDAVPERPAVSQNRPERTPAGKIDITATGARKSAAFAGRFLHRRAEIPRIFVAMALLL